MSLNTHTSSIDPVTLSVVWRRLLTITSEIGYRVMHSAQSFVMGMVQDLGPQFISKKGEILTQVDISPFLLMNWGPRSWTIPNSSVKREKY